MPPLYREVEGEVLGQKLLTGEDFPSIVEMVFFTDLFFDVGIAIRGEVFGPLPDDAP